MGSVVEVGRARHARRRTVARLALTVAMALLASGCGGYNLFAWGLNDVGNLGDGTQVDRDTPTHVGTDADWTDVVAGPDHTCGIRSPGTLWCWGSNTNGRIGDGTFVLRLVPTRIGVEDDWTDIAVGDAHTCGIRSPGTLWCWGLNNHGQLSLGNFLSKNVPTQVGTAATWKAITAGGDHSCGIKTNATLSCWGLNSSGEIGNGNLVNQARPVLIGTGPWTQADAGSASTCAIQSSTLWCWGSNADGRIALGATVSSKVPVQVDASTWIAIDINQRHGCGVRSGGTLWCWGDNAAAQLGDGTTTSHTTPVQIGNVTDWQSIGVADLNTCGIRTSGSLWCWGGNADGRLGDGTTLTRYTPYRIGIGTDWNRVSGGTDAVLGLRTAVGDVDRDFDRLPDSVETNTGVFISATSTGTSPDNPDTDGDGIIDGDETVGTSEGLDLPGMGTNPLRKNILLEFDWFDSTLDCGPHSQRPSAAAVARYQAAFANAEVPNPDGTTGITVISDYGQGAPFTGGNLVADADGVIADGVGGADFVGYKTANFASNRSGYFHYVLMPHRYGTNSSSPGEAELNGDDIVVSLQCSSSAAAVGNSIMHELGHNLGLRHGGNVDTDNKPNYSSVMNTRFRSGGVDVDCNTTPDGVLDYSYGVKVTLNEAALDEAKGVCGPGKSYDWNANSIIDGSPVAVDVNGDSIVSVHSDFNDWANLAYGGI